MYNSIYIKSTKKIIILIIIKGFWPPPDSEKKLLLEITTLLNNILAIEAAFTTCLETQKHYYMDCLAWEEEHQR
jgi:hypothetical protein